jgi:hypothetical protein
VNGGVSAGKARTKPEGESSFTAKPSNLGRADVAQLVEHSLGKGEVTGSIPVISSRFQGKSASQQASRETGWFADSLLPKAG